MPTLVRNSWQVVYASVYALIIRDIQSRFIKSVNTYRPLAFFWIILEPLLHIAIWFSIRYVMGRNMPNFSPLPLPLFILLGAMPFFYFRDTIGTSKKKIKSNKGYYLFRQIKPIDPFISGILSEILINVFVFVVILTIFTWFNVPWHIYDLLFWLMNFFFFSMFLLGFSIILAIVCYFFNFFEIAITILMRFSYILSGVFFTSQQLSEPLRSIMLYNPVFQFIEISRNCFMPPNSYVNHSSSMYLFECGLVVLVLGLGLYLVSKEKIMREIEER
jgi:capsular polysaccharide transport system permease protein